MPNRSRCSSMVCQLAGVVLWADCSRSRLHRPSPTMATRRAADSGRLRDHRWLSGRVRRSPSRRSWLPRSATRATTFWSPGGDVRAAPRAGWQLRGGAKIVSPGITTARPTASSTFPAALVAASPTVCVDINYLMRPAHFEAPSRAGRRRRRGGLPGHPHRVPAEAGRGSWATAAPPGLSRATSGSFRSSRGHDSDWRRSPSSSRQAAVAPASSSSTTSTSILRMSRYKRSWSTSQLEGGCARERGRPLGVLGLKLVDQVRDRLHDPRRPVGVALGRPRAWSRR